MFSQLGVSCAPNVGICTRIVGAWHDIVESFINLNYPTDGGEGDMNMVPSVWLLSVKYVNI